MSQNEPGPWVRGAVVLVLRVGLGMIFLTSGLINYLSPQQQSVGVGPSVLMRMATYDVWEVPFHGLLPYIETAIGLALLLGFFTAAAAIAAIVFYMLTTMLHTWMGMANGLTPTFVGMQHSLLSAMAPNVMLCAAVLWFSPVATNPWSLDRLMFPRRDDPIEPPAKQPPAPEPSPAPPPGERAARFVAGTGDSSADERG